MTDPKLNGQASQEDLENLGLVDETATNVEDAADYVENTTEPIEPIEPSDAEKSGWK